MEDRRYIRSIRQTDGGGVLKMDEGGETLADSDKSHREKE